MYHHTSYIIHISMFINNAQNKFHRISFIFCLSSFFLVVYCLITSNTWQVKLIIFDAFHFPPNFFLLSLASMYDIFVGCCCFLFHILDTFFENIWFTWDDRMFIHLSPVLFSCLDPSHFDIGCSNSNNLLHYHSWICDT